jgi:hypothetical protein
MYFKSVIMGKGRTKLWPSVMFTDASSGGKKFWNNSIEGLFRYLWGKSPEDLKEASIIQLLKFKRMKKTIGLRWSLDNRNH